MKKKVILTIIISICIVFSSYFLVNNKSMTKIKETNNKEFKAYLDDGNSNYYLSTSKVFPTEGFALNYSKTKCDNGSRVIQNDDKTISTSLTGSDACSLYFDWKNNQCNGNTCNFDYTGNIQRFIAPTDGTYKLETWGAQGGSSGSSRPGGYGGYSVGTIKLLKNQNLYLAVGGSGSYEQSNNSNVSNDICKVSASTGCAFPVLAGWNGGGSGTNGGNGTNIAGGGSGGGATSIQSVLILDGQLKNYEKLKEKVYIVSGGGGGSAYNSYTGGNALFAANGGGFKGEKGSIGSVPSGYHKIEEGTQTSGYIFGKGADSVLDYSDSGAGGGWYGGFADPTVNGGGWIRGSGGSGYIGNFLLTDKHMACYNCETSDEESTKTISVTCASETPTEDCAKIGNGYARITYLGNN